MRYMFVAQSISQGGAERVISILSTALSEQNSEAIVVKYFSTEGEYQVGEKVKTVNLSNGDLSDYRNQSKTTIIRSLRKAIKENKPDCIIPFTLPVAELTAIAATGLHVNVFQSIRINPAVMPAQKWKRIIRDGLVHHSKCTFVQNNQQKEYFKPTIQSRIHVLSNPVSEELFSASPKTPNEEFIVCALGRMTDQKNYPLLIDAFKEAFTNTPSAKLKIYGEGTKRETLREYIINQGMSSQIQLMGRTNDVKNVFQEADVYVLSSDWEGMPNALIEAMACHVLSISTDCPTGPADLIDNGTNGILVPVGDKKALSDALLRTYAMPYEERIAMSAKGRDTVKKKCSSQSIAYEFDSICKSVIKR